MTSSKHVHTHHHIHMFLRKYLVPKIYPNAGQTPGTTEEGRIRKKANSTGGPILVLIL